jgi:quercetin dioxygenase-like cupin family protein
MNQSHAPLALLREQPIPWEPADRKTFSGIARVKRLGGAGASPAVRAFRVAFEPGARTHWHVHSGPQILIVVEGRCLVQRWGDPVLTAEAGDVIHIPAGQKHWHGAGAAGPTTHVAVNVDAETTWMEPAPTE